MKDCASFNADFMFYCAGLQFTIEDIHCGYENHNFPMEHSQHPQLSASFKDEPLGHTVSQGLVYHQCDDQVRLYY